MLKAEVELGDGDIMHFNGWIFADEFGTYTIAVRITSPSARDADGDELNVTGIAKLESMPHLGLLWSEDGQSHIAFTVFRLKDTDGIRGFAKLPRVVLTWELALRPEHQAGLGGNVVAFRPNETSTSRPPRAAVRCKRCPARIPTPWKLEQGIAISSAGDKNLGP